MADSLWRLCEWLARYARSGFRALLRACAITWAFLTAAIVWWVIFSVAGLTSIVYGIGLIAGPGWATIAMGIAFLVVSEVIRRGIARA